jgi:hypothetical protein
MNESIGTLIGVSNIVTRSKTRAAAGPALDGQPALRERVRSRALRALEGAQAYVEDALIHGRRVRLFTNSHHLADFWKENFLREPEWRELHAGPPPRTPSVCVHAALGVEDEPEASYADVGRREAYLVNTSYYGDLRACAMEALGRVLAPEGRVLHGAAVEVGGRGLVLLYPKAVIHPVPTFGLMALPDARFVADGWLLADPSGTVHALEKGLYFRASAVRWYPELLPSLPGARFENVPAADAVELDRTARATQEVLDRLRAAGHLANLPSERGREFIHRLGASDDARAMLPATALFGPSRVKTSLRAAAAFGLQAEAGAPTVRPAAIDPFPCAGYLVACAGATGDPRDLARLIARS